MPRHSAELPPPLNKPRSERAPMEDVEAYRSAAESDSTILKNIEHVKERATECVALTETMLERRAEKENNEAAYRQLINFQRLRKGAVHPFEEPLEEPGKNTTVQQCIIEAKGAHSLAFRKFIDGNQARFLSPSGRFYQVKMEIKNGRIHRQLVAADPVAACGQSLSDIQKNIQDTGYADLLFRTYGVPAEQLSVLQNPFHIGWTDLTHEGRAAVATSCLSALTGIEACPETVFRDDGRPATLQRGVNGEAVTKKRIREAGERGMEDPLAQAYARIAALHAMNNESDGGAHNMHGLFSIDNGGAFIPSIPTDAPENADIAERFCAGSIRSHAWEIAERYRWMLPEKNREYLRTIVKDAMTYGALARNKISSPLNYAPHVQSGETANLLTAILRLAHERVDEQGHVIKGTRNLVTVEYANTIARMNYLAAHGRPPVFTDKHFRRKLK